ncbi:hypothetical protein [Candidatus Berkiella aquae]|uniref:Uncharacterized protein n=1 Tax=Candidatus Berkiella aquae TaxID=295108 RepID=A0A0Q9YIC8_9GAMM|nr:hypothetical protein [Candidatus Berkiella aquae]MCS5712296.1 hypothetical protein [Candidatus Berkiella aquae]
MITMLRNTFESIATHTNEYAVAIKNALRASWDFTRAHADSIWQAISNAAVSVWNWARSQNQSIGRDVEADGIAPVQTQAESTLFTQMTRPLTWLHNAASTYLPRRSSTETIEPTLAEMPSATSRATLN